MSDVQNSYSVRGAIAIGVHDSEADPVRTVSMLANLGVERVIFGSQGTASGEGLQRIDSLLHAAQY